MPPTLFSSECGGPQSAAQAERGEMCGHIADSSLTASIRCQSYVQLLFFFYPSRLRSPDGPVTVETGNRCLACSLAPAAPVLYRARWRSMAARRRSTRVAISGGTLGCVRLCVYSLAFRNGPGDGRDDLACSLAGWMTE